MINGMRNLSVDLAQPEDRQLAGLEFSVCCS